MIIIIIISMIVMISVSSVMKYIRRRTRTPTSAQVRPRTKGQG